MNRAQHYVPQLYLKWFIDPMLKRRGREHLWVYEKGKAPRPSAPKEVAHQRDFYSFDHEGERNNLVDEYFQSLESATTDRLLRQFASTGTLPAEDKNGLAMFLGTLSARVPTARRLVDDVAGEQPTTELMRYLDSPDEFRAAFEALQLKVEGSPAPEEIRTKLKEGYRFQQANPFVNLRLLLDMSQKNYEQLLSLQWSVWQSDSDYHFVTSDNPVVSILPEPGGGATLGRSMSEPKIEVIFPLSTSACLFANRSLAPGVRVIPGHMVKRVNKVVMAMAERWMFGSECSRRLAKAFDSLGSTGAFGEDFYTPEAKILKRTTASAATNDDEHHPDDNEVTAPSPDHFGS